MPDESRENPGFTAPVKADALPKPPALPATIAPPDANQLSPEEQMALFEKELKENDWGHQPC